MQRRQITLEDGRYLIFYTFEEAAASASPDTDGDDAAGAAESNGGHAEPDAEPQATEEKRV
ncbi:MAG TPA: hypothetical protein VEY11_17845 [Pyrinomonadaceae bacterium]|nr:hypothetical protein [Pyrinomonadaceae bacterium]